MQDVYVGNLPYKLSEEDVKDIFTPFGSVDKVTLIVDHHSGRKKGYGFVKMCEEGATKAVDVLNLSECHGRTIKVSFAPSR